MIDDIRVIHLLFFRMRLVFAFIYTLSSRCRIGIYCIYNLFNSQPDSQISEYLDNTSPICEW